MRQQLRVSGAVSSLEEIGVVWRRPDQPAAAAHFLFAHMGRHQRRPGIESRIFKEMRNWQNWSKLETAGVSCRCGPRDDGPIPGRRMGEEQQINKLASGPPAPSFNCFKRRPRRNGGVAASRDPGRVWRRLGSAAGTLSGVTDGAAYKARKHATAAATTNLYTPRPASDATLATPVPRCPQSAWEHRFRAAIRSKAAAVGCGPASHIAQTTTMGPTKRTRSARGTRDPLAPGQRQHSERLVGGPRWSELSSTMWSRRQRQIAAKNLQS